MQEDQQRRVREAIVYLVLEARAEYLAGGANPLKHWDQIQDRMRAAARTSRALPDWATAFARGLSLSAPSKGRSSAILELMTAADGETSRVLALVEDEHSYLIALARRAAEEARARKAPMAQGETAC